MRGFFSKLLNGEPVVGRAINRLDVRFSPRVAARRARQLQRQNETSAASVLGDAPAMVSLTTYGPRFPSVHLAIESIAAGLVRPQRLVLWLDETSLLDDPTPELRRLVERGLEIRPAPSIGSHKKYYSAVMTIPPTEDHLLVTADDDVIYPVYWLKELVESSRRSPGNVWCFRARRVAVRDGMLQPYSNWRDCWGTSPALHHFAVGVSGVAYPPAMIRALREAGTGFLDCAPTGDDIWLHRTAVEAGIATGQVRRRPRHFPMVPGSQSVSLSSSNVDFGGNDRQIAATYSPAAVQALVRSVRSAGA